jgi:O-antigen/teichoic acid export membrane protein
VLLGARWGARRSGDGSAGRLGARASDARRSTLVMCDQALASGSNFVLAVAVGRWLGPRDLGTLALVLAVWLVLYGLFRALVEDPLAILADAYSTRTAVSAGLVLALAGSAAVSVASLALDGYVAEARSVLFLGVMLTPLLMQDLWRRIAFLRQRPQAALLNDGVYCVIEVVALGTCRSFHLLTLSTAIVWWGCGAAGGALIGFWQFSTRPSSLLSGATMLWKSRVVSLWIGLDFLVNRSMRQVSLFVIAAVVGSRTLGGIQASTNLLAFTNILILGAGSAALADGAVRLQSDGLPGMRRAVASVTSLATLLVLLCAALYSGLSAPLLTKLYGESYRPFVSLAPIVALQVVVGCLELLPTTELRLLRETRRMFWTRLIFAPVGIAAVWPLCTYGGAHGAAASGAVVTASLTSGAWVALGRARKDPHLSHRYAEQSIVASA